MLLLPMLTINFFFPLPLAGNARNFNRRTISFFLTVHSYLQENHLSAVTARNLMFLAAFRLCVLNTFSMNVGGGGVHLVVAFRYLALVLFSGGFQSVKPFPLFHGTHPALLCRKRCLR